MTIHACIHRFDPAAKTEEPLPSGAGRVRGCVARHRLTDEEHTNLRDYYRCTPGPSPALMTAALGGHPRRERGAQR
jgi:hypothetical protein